MTGRACRARSYAVSGEASREQCISAIRSSPTPRCAAAANHRGRLGQWDLLPCSNPQSLPSELASLIAEPRSHPERHPTSNRKCPVAFGVKFAHIPYWRPSAFCTTPHFPGLSPRASSPKRGQRIRSLRLPAAHSASSAQMPPVNPYPHRTVTQNKSLRICTRAIPGPVSSDWRSDKSAFQQLRIRVLNAPWSSFATDTALPHPLLDSNEQYD